MIAAVFLRVLLCLSLWTPLCEATASSSTCPFRTVNYITHSLPQQCLTSSRSLIASITAAQKSDITSTPATGHASLNETDASSPAQRLTSEDVSSIELEEPTSSSTASSATSIQSATISVTSISPDATKISVSDVKNEDTEADSALENGKFLSFEDWKKQNLVKAGQSEHLGGDRQIEQREPRTRPTNVHNALDSIGDDVEIDLDFSGFVPTSPDLAGPKHAPKGGQDEMSVQSKRDEIASRRRSRGKDAGTTSKERFNYASFDCAANVLKTNKQAKSPSAVLGENKDYYMLNECAAENKFLILELCSDIQIDTIVLANFEFFSSTFRTVHVSVSDKYPVKTDKWKTLGTFEAKNSREVQAFLVENPVIWTRFVRFEFLTHYGREFYCPLSLVRIHGTTMLEEYKHDIDNGQGDDDEDDVATVEQANEQEVILPKAVAEVIAEEENVAVPSNVRKTEIQAPVGEGLTETPASDDALAETDNEPHCDQFERCQCTLNATVRNRALLLYPSLPGTYSDHGTSRTKLQNISQALSAWGSLSVAAGNVSSPSSTMGNGSKFAHAETHSNSLTTATRVSPTQIKTSSGTHWKRSVSSTTSMASSPSSIINGTSTEKPKTMPSSTQAAAAVPTIQESFFKSVQKRLQMLETNSSLSLQYIEEQSRALRHAFGKVEQRQLAKTSTFLEYLNSTVLSELRDFRQQYDHLWQSTVIELEVQREQFRQETVAINARLGVLADEVIFQKRMAILQMVLILVCLGLVLFSKGSMHHYLELPMVHSILSRSPNSKWMNVPGLETPSQSPAISRPGSSHQLKPERGTLKGHHRGLSEDSIAATASPNDPYSPVTPIAQDESSDNERVEGHVLIDDPVFDPATFERPSTSPPVLPGTDRPMTPESLPILDDSSIDSRVLDHWISENTLADHGPRVVVENAKPQSKHLAWREPDS